jgi:prepilin-type N-terminal cleavage/methylation domain-containing protein
MLMDTPARLRIADCGLRIAEFRCVNPKSEIRNPKFRGLTLIEVVASTLIVGIMAVAALNTLGAATRSADSIGNRAAALGLADELMSEILQTAYSDPSQPPVFGAESGETAGPRSAFDDVDDYNGWNKSPPQYRDGSTIPDRANWSQRVQVTYVQPANPSLATPGNTDQGAKRIKVTIEYKNKALAEQYAIRTNFN